MRTVACLLLLAAAARAADRPFLQGAWLYTANLGWNESMHEKELAASIHRRPLTHTTGPAANHELESLRGKCASST